MARYAFSNTTAGSQQSVAVGFIVTNAVLAATGATTLRRGWIDELEVGADGSINATDCQVLWDWSRQTLNDGTSTAGVANPTPDGADAAALLTYRVNYSVQPTVAANSSLLAFPTNQRQSQRCTWADFRMSPLIIPATNVNGVAGRAKSATYNSTAQMQEFVVE
jgi:hypothetical protein